MSILITSAIVAKETLTMMRNNLIVAGHVDFQYNDEFSKTNGKIGNSFSLPKPVGYTGTRNNMAWNGGNSSVVENYVKLVIDRTYTIPLSFTEGDLSLKLVRFSDRYIKPATANIASNLDADLVASIVNSVPGALSATSGQGTGGLDANALGVANSAGYAIGAYGTPITPTLITQAKQILLDQSVPDDGEIYGFLSTTAQQQLTIANTTIFHPLTNVDELFRKGEIGTFAGIRFYTTQSMVQHINGVQPTLVVSAGGNGSAWAETATLTVTATAGAINAGDVFQAPAQYIVNYQTKQVTATPFQVQVLATYTLGVTSVLVSPAPIISGPYQNVSASLNGVTLQLTGAQLPGISVVGTAAQGLSGVESLIFHKSAVVAASPGLYTPKASAFDLSQIISDEDAPDFRIRLLQGFDILGVSGVAGAGGVGSSGPAQVTRFDIQYGYKTAQTAWIIRLRN